MHGKEHEGALAPQGPKALGSSHPILLLNFSRFAMEDACAYREVHDLPGLARPLIGQGGGRSIHKDNPKVFNVALRVPGDDMRKSMATISDLLALSRWFEAYVSSGSAGLGGSADLLAGVEVACEVPWEILEAAVEGLYQVRTLPHVFCWEKSGRYTLRVG